jgi:predicted nucleotidyltransferase component of viral defense system
MANLPDDQAIDIVFKAIALSEELSQELVLKGGNALKKVFRSPRASVDLDFTDRTTLSKASEGTLQKFLDACCQELDSKLKELIVPSSTTIKFA